jgi:protein subunit release factor B
VSAVSPSADKAALLARRMAALGVRDTDLDESFIRSGGHGGQNVNKTATCVMLVHRPTGLLVKCQTTRYQGLNRFLARQRLLDQIEARQRSRAAADRARREKQRRQNRRPSDRAKQRMLEDKAHRSVKKAGRQFVDFD